MQHSVKIILQLNDRLQQVVHTVSFARSLDKFRHLGLIQFQDATPPYEP